MTVLAWSNTTIQKRRAFGDLYYPAKYPKVGYVYAPLITRQASRVRNVAKEVAEYFGAS